MRVLVMANGDPRDPRTASGIPSHLFAAMERREPLAGAISCLPDVWVDRLIKLRSIAPTRRAWVSRYRLSMPLTREFERSARQSLAAFGNVPYDAFLQLGAYCNVSHIVRTPVFSYHDNDVLTMTQMDPRMRGTSTTWPNVRARVAHEKSVFDSDTRVFTFSQWCAEQISTKYDIPEAKVESVGAGSNIARELLAGERDYSAAHVVFIGFDFVRKGGPTLLEAFARVKQQLPAARLTVVGGGPVGEAASGVTALGIVRGEEARANVLRSASLFVMPSVWEPFGLVFLEAMAAGVPCIGSNICAIPEIIGETGMVVPPQDAPALARAMFEMLSDPAGLAELGRAARARFDERYGWDRAAERMADSMAAALNLNASPSSSPIG